MLLPGLLLFLPLVSTALILLVTRRFAGISAYLATASAVATLACSLALLRQDIASETEAVLFSWAKIGDLSFDIGVQLDRLSRGMLFVVTAVGALVHIFSLGYMRDDEGKARYFAGLSLFMFSMTGIVLANNFVMMFLFWELVGVSSYILIGHWYTKNTAADAANKAFLTNRVGDFGFMAGILLLWGLTGAVDFKGIEAQLPVATALAPGLVTAAALCIFAGAVGKSAQFPLHVWLPDAMEGPTPVSALIHAATMVAAGVYMLVRASFVVGSSATASLVIACVGGGTALLAALIATQQDDIKKILAYSTLSQLGYMVMAVGLKAGDAAMFHLFTHAFFKALLFLGAGAVIFACHHEQNIWKMGGLMKRMPFTFWTFAIGTAALVAVPLTSGFYSKESILEAALHANPLFFTAAAAVAFLTTFYMTRLLLVAFFGSARGDGASHAQDGPLVMRIPLAVLALGSLVAGFPIVATLFQAMVPEALASDFHILHFNMVFAVSLGALVIGALAALLFYTGRDSDPFSLTVLKKKFFFDELYAKLVAIFQDTVAQVARFFDDYLIGGLLVKGSANTIAGIGDLLRRFQLGNLHGYALLFGVGVIVIIYVSVFLPL